MSVKAFDHVNIRTTDVSGTLNFFNKVLDMRISPFPGRSDTSTAGWVLDENDRAVIHVNTAEEVYPTDATWPWSPTKGSGAAHHVALNCDDYDGMRGRLDGHRISYITNEVPQINLRQLFVHEVNDITLELNFRG